MVANKKSQKLCENLIYSIRASGCLLPIRLIHFGGDKVNSEYVTSQVELLNYEDFSTEAKFFISNLRGVLTDCPIGYLYRYLAWFLDWDEFIYTDNDIVALCNWELLFEYLAGHDLVHADEEYTTKGIYNYYKPELIQVAFGNSALDTAITAGHIVINRSDKMVADINAAIEWFKINPHIPQKHDQSLLHVASLLGSWKTLNLCKAPYHWLSSWSGDYRNSLQLVQDIQTKGAKVSHIHYSGGMPKGNLAIQELLFSSESDESRLMRLAFIALNFLTKYERLNHYFSRIRKLLNRKFV